MNLFLFLMTPSKLPIIIKLIILQTIFFFLFCKKKYLENYCSIKLFKKNNNLFIFFYFRPYILNFLF